MAVTQHVVPHGGKWAVRAEGSRRASRVVATQEEAVEVARQRARSRGVDVIVHDADGNVVTEVAAAKRPMPRWLAIAEEIKRQAPETPLYRRPKRVDASLERLRELAGSISLSGPAPSRDFFDE